MPKFAQPVEEHLPDYEAELTVVIGKPAKNVSEENALDYVLAYTAGNDVRISYSCLSPTKSAADEFPEASNDYLSVGILQRLWSVFYLNRGL